MAAPSRMACMAAIAGLAIMSLVAVPSQAFYLPGVSPKGYKLDEQVSRVLPRVPARVWPRCSSGCAEAAGLWTPC